MFNHSIETFILPNEQIIPPPLPLPSRPTMNLVSFSRLYISSLLFTIGGWVYFTYLFNYTETQSCYNELTSPIKILVGISMSLMSICILCTSNYVRNERSFDDIFADISSMYCNMIGIIILLTITSILGLTIFIRTSGMTNTQCSNENAEFGLKLAVYGVIWIIMVEMVIIMLCLVLPFMVNVIMNAKLDRLCCNIFKKYNERRIGVISDDNRPVRSIIPKYNTFHITVPIPVKESPRATCSVCYDNSITLLLEPCNHVCLCDVCYGSLASNVCPICKTPIETTRKIYFAIPYS